MGQSLLARANAFESAAATEGVGDLEIHFSRLTGMSPNDIEVLRQFTIREGLLIVIRCPKRASRYQHGLYPAKRFVTKAKSDEASGLVLNKHGGFEVSDYDLMCVYRCIGNGEYEKVFFSGVDKSNPKSPLTPDAVSLLRKVQWELKSKFQHGAQDDFDNEKNPGVEFAKGGKSGTRFAAFNMGTIDYLPTPREANAYYAKYGLKWPYDDEGRYVG